MAFTEDLGAFFDVADFSESATWGALSASVIIDVPTEEVLGGKVNSNEYMMMMQADQLPGISYKDAFTITTGRYAGTYIVRDVKLIEDGAIKSIKASKQ